MTTDDDLIPVRALNQVTYCPRLYYLEYVEAVMPINEHVEDGLFQHRRVDDPSLQHRSRKEGEVVHTRSVQVGSTRLGLTGKLDLVEEKDGRVYPVEYKRGTGPPSSDGPRFWDNDAVQVCAKRCCWKKSLAAKFRMALSITSAARPASMCRSMPISVTKRCTPFKPSANCDMRDAPPEPLPCELRHRCFGCSLAPICQPEETLYLLGRQPLTPTEEAAAGITRVLPQTDDGAVLYLQEPGSHVGKRSEHLVVRKDGQETQRVPIAAIRQVVVFGNVQVSTQALECLATLEVPVIYMTGYGRFIAALQPAPTKNVLLRINQFRLFADPAVRPEVGQSRRQSQDRQPADIAHAFAASNAACARCISERTQPKTARAAVTSRPPAT